MSYIYINIYDFQKAYTVIILYLDIINDENENVSSYYSSRNISSCDSGLDIISSHIIISYLIKNYNNIICYRNSSSGSFQENEKTFYTNQVNKFDYLDYYKY